MPDIPLVPPEPRLERPGSIEAPARAPFVELGLVSCFSFLRGASRSTELVPAAHALGYDALGIADVNSLAGVVRIHSDAKSRNIRPIVGSRIETIEGLAFLAYPGDRAAYGRLCRLISAGRMDEPGNAKRREKGVCEISLRMLSDHCEGMHLILVPPDNLAAEFTVEIDSNVVSLAQPTCQGAGATLTGTLTDLLPHLVVRLPAMQHIAATYLYVGNDIARIEELNALAKRHGLSLLATNDVLYHVPDRRPLQDVMTAIRHKTTVAQAGLLLQPNAERHLKSPAEMVRLFARWPHAIEAAREVADACRFSLDDLRYDYPDADYPDGLSAQQYLERLTWEGAAGHYPNGTPESVRKTLRKEFDVIRKLDLARYFLTIRDIVDFARTRDPPILCQGRGSAANSAVCFCLGITGVNPAENNLLFERFIMEKRSEPPDIDVDFEHERREEVIQHIYNHYSRERAGLCATVIHYRPRMAIREVGKAMGLTEDVTSLLARTVWGSWGQEAVEKHAAETGLDLNDPYLRRVLKLANEMIGMPRHLSQHVGGFVLTQGLLTETVPIGNGAMADRTFIEWDKDDLEELKIFKVDVLALGMLTCIRKCFDLIAAHHGPRLSLANIERDDAEVYDMLCKGDSLGVFQVESRAQMNMLPRLKPREFYDLVIEVAIVRPGPIQGDMVHPYLKRRREREKERIDYPKPLPEHGLADELSSILERTLGVPIFQEQALQIALDAAKFSSEEANQLRRAMATFRSRGNLDDLEGRMVGRMVERGYDAEFSQRCFNQIKGFGEYGFPESHAASFAHLVYVSSWLKCHYPAAFACGLLNSQPMGFYAPAQIVRDARDHGVIVLPVDVNHSQWDCTLEEVADFAGASSSVRNIDPHIALRLGFRQIDGFSRQAAEKLASIRQGNGAFADVAALLERAKLHPSQIEKLAAADAFTSLGLSRRQALWDARSLVSAPDLPLFAAANARDEGAEQRSTRLPLMPLSEEVVADYQTHRLSLKAHPLAFLRTSLADRGFTKACDLGDCKRKGMVQVAGVVLVRQRPGSAKNVVFITIEDETGVANIVVWPHLMEKYRKVIMGARLMEVRGRVEYEDGVIHVIAAHLADGTPLLDHLSDDSLTVDLARADHVNRPLQGSRGHEASGRGHPRNVRIIPKSRDFH